MIESVSISKLQTSCYVVHIHGMALQGTFSSISEAIEEVGSFTPALARFVNLDYYGVQLETMPVEKLRAEAIALADRLMFLYAQLHSVGL